MPGPEDVSGSAQKSVLNGRYRVGPSAGRWPYGEAALAADEWTYKTVVLKRISPDLHGGAGGLGSLRAWAEQLKAVKHAALPVIEDLFEDDGKLVLVQERLEGEALNAFLNSGSQIQLPSALVFLCQVAAGLDHAHSSGFVHGNLQPGNILITRTGRAKLLDFGLGLALRRASSSAGGVIPEGTAYMAPEQERGEAVAASDLYAMAMILFQMTTGRLPFEDPGDWDVKRRLRLRSAGHLAPQLPVEFDGVVARAFHPEPSGRYAACAELITALERLT